MDLTGGTNPSNPRLDGVGPRPMPTRPAQQTSGISQPVENPVSFEAQSSNQTLDGMSGVPQQPMQQAVTPPTLENPIPSQMAAPVASAQINNPVEEQLLDQPMPKKSSGALKKVLIILGVLVGLGALGGGAFYVGYTMGVSQGRQKADADYQKQLAAQQEMNTEEKTDEAEGDELNVKNLIDPKYVDETIDGEVGKQVQASDGFVIKVSNIERNFKSEDPNYKLDTSKELIKVNFLIGNVDKSKSKDISSFNFRLENSAGAQLTPENVASYEGKFDTIKLDPGGQAKGSIVYAVNKDEKPLKFIREQRYRISGENREVTTRIVVVVAKT